MLVFWVLAAVVAAGFFTFLYYRDKMFSKEILRVEILGKDEVLMGEEIEYTIKYKNNGNFVLENPKLVFQLPENSLTEEGKMRLTQTLEDIYPGDEKFVKIKARLLGKEGDVKTAHAWLSYTPKKLSARYESDTTFTTKIESVPIALTYDLPSKIEKGKEISYEINYFSSIDYPLENLSVKIDEVGGFSVKSSVPASLDKTEWKLETLQKGQGGRITIKGFMGTDAQPQLDFTAKLGMWVDGVFVVIKEARQEVAVIQPQIVISQEINGSSAHVASPGETLEYKVSFRNIGSTPFENIFAAVKLDGFAYDFSTLQSTAGQARQNERLVTFDAKQVPQLRRLAPQQEAVVDFRITLKNTWTPSDDQKNNTAVKNTVTAMDVAQEFAVKVNSKLEMTQKVTPEGGTYQISWQVKNYFNDVKNVKVKALLWQGATLDDAIVPESQAPNFSFDNKSREIVWLAGDLSTGAGVTTGPETLSFQVSAPMGMGSDSIISQVGVFGEDQFTGAAIQGSIVP